MGVIDLTLPQYAENIKVAKLKIKNILILALSGLALGAGLFFYMVLASMQSEGERAIRARLFTGIGDRAIQLDRLSKLGVPYSNIVRTKAPNNLYENWEDINCEMNIFAPPFYPKQENSVVAILKPSPSRDVYLIYHGSPPKFEPFLLGSDALSLLGSLTYFEPRPPNATANYTQDLSAQYKSVMKGQLYSWESTICANFTFTLFMEQTSG